MKDLVHNLLPIKTITPIVGNNTSEGTGVGVDLAGFEGALMIAHVGISGDTLSGSVYMTVAFQDSDASGSGYANIPAAQLLGGANDVVIDDAAEDDVIIARSYIGNKQYVRVLITFTGTHTAGTPIQAQVTKGFPRHAPVV